MALLDDTKVYKPWKDITKNCTETSRKPFDSSTGNMVLPDYIGGANAITKIAHHR